MTLTIEPPLETSPLLPPVSKSDNDAETENPHRPTGVRFAIVFACILVGDFFVGYDTSCVTTLAPVISDEFRTMDDLGWYGIAYILASASTVLVLGQLYTIFPMKAIFLASFAIFAAGSMLSALAPSSAVFIAGRAVSGLGSAGIFSGGSIIVANTTPLKTRPIYQALSGGMECTALALGPLVAGALAAATSWRACFGVIVPVTLCIIVAVGAFVHDLPAPEHASFNTRERLQRLDLLGIALFVPMSVALILALQWGGIVYDWSEAQVIVPLALAGVLAVAFGYAQWRAGEHAMFPLQLLRERSVSLGIIAQAAISACLFVFGFYLPIYFQAVRGASTLDSGLMYLPTAASFALAMFLAGNITTWIGYYTPVMAVGTLLLAVGAGLMTTFSTDTPAASWIAYQLLFGAGAGLAFQQTYTAVQTVLPPAVVPTALVCLCFAQELGGIGALALAQNVFLRRVVARLTALLPDLDPRTIIDNGAVSLPELIPAPLREAVYAAYMQSIREVFVIGVVCACLTVCALGIEWRSVNQEKADAEAESEET